MINFSLSEEQLEFQALARDFAVNEIKPKAAHYDEAGEFPEEILRKAFEIGLMNIHLPDEYGGLGLSGVDGSLISEEIGAACTGIGTAMEANTLALAPLMYGASEEMKKRVFPQFVEEFTLACYCVTEPNAGSDTTSIETFPPVLPLLKRVTNISSMATRCGSHPPDRLTGCSCWQLPTRHVAHVA